MAVPTFARLSRFIGSIFAPATAIFGFSCLLTFIFVLYQPHLGPGAVQRLGWQSWDPISDIAAGAASQSATGGNESEDIAVPSSGAIDGPVDWWNVTAPDETHDYASLPLDVWDPLMPHDTGFSEIEIASCFIDPFAIPYLASDICSPSTTKEQDAQNGKWVKVGPNLNFQGYSFMNVYYRRTRRLDTPLVIDIKILGEHDTPSPFSSAWVKVSKPVSPRGPKRYLWYLKGKTMAEMSNEEKRNIITEIDVTYGDDVAWYGFDHLVPPVADKDSAKKLEAVSLTIRRGVKLPPKAGPLHFSHDGNFKIMQIADLHFSVGEGVCRDTTISPCTASDNLTMTLLARVLDQEKPDLVVFTGDQLNGQGTSWDSRAVLAKFAREVTKRQIPWAAIFGNHDDEDGDSREIQIKYMQGLPYSLVQQGPKDIHGVGNYVLKVYSADSSKTQLLTLYFLDSGAYSNGKWDLFGLFHGTEYDWIHQDQIDWFLEESSRISTIERPFAPDGVKDIGGVWSRQDQVTPQLRLAKPNAMMFFHIPLAEAYSAADKDPITGKPLDVGIHDEESPGNAKHQDGFFHKGLLQAMESEHRGVGSAREVKVVANGHSHVTENCRRIKGIWSCFGGGGSYSGYGRIGFDRRFRIYQISDYGETIHTYKHTESIDMLDWQILSGQGAPGPSKRRSG
ncbi:Metallo-dependent phosphatase [Irpex rosettiformis]|uniref:Metallo-dependent phosphatase n=1 Tax=Irpex rosettiformis TaxID=378272 RepID=A0ACB8TVD7_9APHY|nr:Metallo-dependent phosphatase [Irpex rosettiformis]